MTEVKAPRTWITKGVGATPHQGEHDPNCSGQHTPNGYCVPEPGGGAPRGEREKAGIDRNAKHVRGILRHFAHEVGLASQGGHRGLEDDDAAELRDRLAAEVKALPARVRARVMEAGAEVMTLAAAGERGRARAAADEVAIAVGAELGTWRQPPAADEDDPEAIAAGIPR